MNDKIITKIRSMFQWNTWHLEKYPIEFELKEDAKPICSRPYPVPKVHEKISKKYFERLVLPVFLELANN